jgi:hypothetical protein
MSPTREPTSSDPSDSPSARLLCNAPPTWRLITAEADAIGAARTMFTAVARAANAANDPSIPTVELRADRMFAIGVCRPNPAGLRVPDVPFEPIAIWNLPSHGPPVAIAGARILDLALFELGEAYYGPPEPPNASGSPTTETMSWGPGRYVLELDGTSSGEPSLWLGLNFVTPTGDVAPSGGGTQ